MKTFLILSSIPLIAALVYYVVQQFKPRVKRPNELNPQYDYIIVGGGTAGCVLAARLSEDAKISVLLLEAGGEENQIFYSHIPGVAHLLQETDFDWNFFTVPQDECCSALHDQQVKWPRGKVLGGSSVLNFVHYTRGHESNFDQWEESLASSNLPSRSHWSSKDVEPYFQWLENVEVDRLRASKGRRGKDGPISLSENRALKTAAGEFFAHSLTSAGIIPIDDVSIPKMGFGAPLFTVKNGKRVSSASAYLRPAMGRPNLHVVTRARVNRVTFNFNDEQKKAAGVEFEYNGARHRILTNREVLLAAGAVGSPHILQLSGIGPKEQIEKFGIQTVKDLPSVGQHLKDHVGVLLRYSTNGTVGLDSSDFLSFSGLAKSLVQYVFSGSGLLAYPPIELMGFFGSHRLTKNTDNLVDSTNSMTSPDLQFFFAPVDLLATDTSNMLNAANISDDIPSNQASPSAHVFSIGVALLKPQSTGKIWLQSADPDVPPLIDPRYFLDDADFTRLSEGLKFLNRIVAQNENFQALDVKIDEKFVAGCHEIDISTESEKFLNCLVRNRPQTAYHPTGTCKMGVDTVDSVVDSELRVHGVEGLRVVDASVVPDQISANIGATVLMIAEKAADIIKHTPH